MTWEEIRVLHPWLPATCEGWHQHANGGGWVHSDKATVATAAYVGPAGVVYGGVMYGGAMYGGAIITDGMVVRSHRDLLVIGPLGRRNAYLTLTRTHAATGCFSGTWEELRARLTDENRADYEAALAMAAARWPAV